MAWESDLVRDWLLTRQRGFANLGAIATLTGVSRNTVRKVLRELDEAGQLETDRSMPGSPLYRVKPEAAASARHEPGYPWRPDWTIAPSETLRDWMAENGMTERVIAVVAGGRRDQDSCLALITEVLERKPLGDEHARILARGTQVPARFWLALEHNYRAGLAAGLKDVSGD